MRGNISSGTITIIIQGKRYPVRPTIGTLCEIERQTNLSTVSLLSLLQVTGLPMPDLRRIVHAVTQAVGHAPDETDLTDEALHEVTPQLCIFLLRGIGHTSVPYTPPDIQTLRALRQPDWCDMFMTYVGIMGHSAQEFWQITLAEYALAVEGYCMANAIDMASAAIPATSQDLAEMLQRFPDRKVEVHNL